MPLTFNRLVSQEKPDAIHTTTAREQTLLNAKPSHTHARGKPSMSHQANLTTRLRRQAETKLGMAGTIKVLLVHTNPTMIGPWYHRQHPQGPGKTGVAQKHRAHNQSGR